MRAVWSFTVCGVLGCAPTASTTEYARFADGDGGGGAAAAADASTGSNDARRGPDARAAEADAGGPTVDARASGPDAAGTPEADATRAPGPDAALAPGVDAALAPWVDAAQSPAPDAGPAVDDRCPGRVPDPAERPAVTRWIADLTGTRTSSGAFGVGGTDLGIPVRQPDGQIAYVFGDTFEEDRAGGPGWRSPVLLRSPTGLGPEGIVFTGAAGGRYARQILDYDHADPEFSTWLPSDVITLGGRMYLHFIVNAGLGNVRWTQIAYSDDNGEHWALSDARWAADEDGSLRQLWTWERGCDGYDYTLSTSFIDRSHPIILHRVPEDRLLDRNAYEPWGFRDGRWAWGHAPTPVLDGRFGELSLRRVEDKWVLSWFNAADYDITVKVFDAPTSNLYEARTYKPVTGAMLPQLYGGYIHPDSTLANLHLIVSQWNTADGWPYRATQWVTSVR